MGDTRARAGRDQPDPGGGQGRDHPRGGESVPAPGASGAPPAHTVAGSSTHRWRRVGASIGRGLVTAVVTCVPVAVLAGLVQAGFPPLHDVDEAVIRAATDASRARPELVTALIAWQEVFLPWHVYLAAAPAVVWTWRRGLQSRAVWGLATGLAGWNLGLDVKLLVQRARPVVQEAVSSAPGYSFPSGHVFNLTMASATVLVMTWPLLVARSRTLARSLATLAGVAVVLTAADRILLGVHYPSDTVAGVLLALALTYSSWSGFRHAGQVREQGERHA